MLRKSFVKFSLLFALVIVLVVGLAIPTFADTGSTATPTTPVKAALHTVQGTVTAISGTSSFNIQDANKASVTVNVGASTKYYLLPIGKIETGIKNQVSKDIGQNKGKQTVAGAMKDLHIPANWKDNLGWLDTFAKGAAFSDIAVGDRIVARVDVNNLAAQVLIITGPVIRQAKGTVTISGNSITVTVSGSAAPVVLTWDANTEFIMKGVISAPSGQYGVVTYNSTTNIAQLVNFSAKAPSPPTTSTTTTTSN